MNFIFNNEQYFQTTSSILIVNRRYEHHLHRRNVNLRCFQKSTFYGGIKIFNNLPRNVTNLKTEKAKLK